MALGKYDPPDEKGGRSSARIELWDSAGFFVIIEGESCITYSNQTGGFACAHPAVEGHLIPMDRYCGGNLGEDLFEGLREITLDYWGEGMLDWLKKPGLESKKGIIGRLKKLVEALHPAGWYISDNGLWCELDMDRLQDAVCGESWLPVNTPMGRGWLTWENSD